MGNCCERDIVTPTHQALYNVRIFPFSIHLHWLNQNHLAQIRAENVNMENCIQHYIHSLEYWKSSVLHPPIPTTLNMNLKIILDFKC